MFNKDKHMAKSKLKKYICTFKSLLQMNYLLLFWYQYTFSSFPFQTDSIIFSPKLKIKNFPQSGIKPHLKLKVLDMNHFPISLVFFASKPLYALPQCCSTRYKGQICFTHMWLIKRKENEVDFALQTSRSRSTNQTEMMQWTTWPKLTTLAWYLDSSKYLDIGGRVLRHLSYKQLNLYTLL
jgi:hypothetical protein